jgi:hypothetical protein
MLCTAREIAEYRALGETATAQSGRRYVRTEAILGRMTTWQ